MQALKIVGLIILGIVALYGILRALNVTLALFLGNDLAAASAYSLGYWFGTVLFAGVTTIGFWLLLRKVRSTK